MQARAGTPKRASVYDVAGRMVDFSQRHFYVTTDVANAWRAIYKWSQGKPGGGLFVNFKKDDPINGAIVEDWLSTHPGGDNAYIIEDNALAGLIGP
jgi:hypothetical protein